jgi:DnaJ-class molecular chaperone
MIDPLQSGSGQAHGPETCRVCGGDGRIDNSFGSVAKCPSCHGSGKRAQDTGFHDVTKTKPSHHVTNRAGVAEKQTWPSTAMGAQLATEIRDAAALSADTKARLTREIIEHEGSHGLCTQTFLKKMRKQCRPAAR